MRSSPRKQSTRARSHGFTLMEAMVVVAIIGISAAIAAPALTEAMAHRRANEATHALVRLGARAQAETLLYGRAHLLAYSTTSSGPDGNNGSVQVWRGRTNLCAATVWGTIMTGSCSSNPDCIDQLDMGAYAFPTNRVRMRLAGAGSGFLCYQPNGEMFSATSLPGGGSGWTRTPPDGGTEGVRFTFQRLQGGATVGVQRQVVFPFGAAPRIAR